MPKRNRYSHSRKRRPRARTLFGAKLHLGIDRLEDRRLLCAPYPLLVPQALGGLDFGDAPNSYGTTLASNGARHTTTALFLGANADDEADAQAPLNGTGDDVSATDDENGVTISPLS